MGVYLQVCVDMALAVQMASVAESMAFGMELGLEPKALAAILNASASRCWSSTNYNPVPVSENLSNWRASCFFAHLACFLYAPRKTLLCA